MSALQQLDLGIVRTAQELRNPLVNAVMLFVSALLPRLAAAAVALVIVTRQTRSWRPAVAAIVATTTAWLASDWLKQLFDRARPPRVDATITAVGSLPASASMPSGHASSAFAFAVALALFAPRLRWWLLGAALLIALSRVWLGVHFPSDVAVGALFGAVVGLLVALAFGARRSTAGGPRRSPST